MQIYEIYVATVDKKWGMQPLQNKMRSIDEAFQKIILKVLLLKGLKLITAFNLIKYYPNYEKFKILPYGNWNYIA